MGERNILTHPIEIDNATTCLLILLSGLVAFVKCNPKPQRFAAVAAEAAGGDNDNDCACQCPTLTFVDDNGRTNGNCKTSDNTGARWCYVRERDNRFHSQTCQDRQQSSRYPDIDFSYHACATPALDTRQCSSFRF